LILALLAALFGFGGIAGEAASGIAQLSFYIYLFISLLLILIAWIRPNVE